MSAVLPIVASVLFATWGTGMLIALWFKPRLRKVWLFTPRWRIGQAASRGAATVQALHAYSLAALLACKVAGAGSKQALLVFLLFTAASGIAWVVDGANAAARES